MPRRIEDMEGYNPADDPRVDEAVERDQEFRWWLRQAEKKRKEKEKGGE